MQSDSTGGGAISMPAGHRSALFAMGLLLCGVVATLVDLTAANTLMTALREAVTGYFDWLFVAMLSGVLILVLILACHPLGRLRLGRADERAQFSRFSWFAMLFSAGLGPGLVYWGMAEPITHHAGHPFAEVQDIPAVVVTIFHWGLHGWGLYALGGLAIGLAAYRQGYPLTFSAALTPVLGERRMQGAWGRGIDLLAVFGTVFGVATSLGLAVSAMNAVLEPLTDLPFGAFAQVVLVLSICLLGVLSVLSGVQRGIRWLSEMNIWFSGLFLLGLLAVSPSLELVRALAGNAWIYLQQVLAMGWWVADSAPARQWQSDWTIFYWGWWLAWTPFVALFIARISRGRTVREFVLGVLLVPSVMVIVWMSICGEAALVAERLQPGVVSEAVAADYSLGLVATLAQLVPPTLYEALLSLVALLLFTWLITSLDSATLVICHTLQVDESRAMKISWGLLLGAVTAALMLMGGMQALQAASIVVGLPLALLMLLVCVAVWRLLNMPEPRH